MDQMTGIYALINVVTGKVYVGQAFNFQRRWKNHAIELRLNRHCNPYLQASWNKYTEDSFIFIVLETCDKDKETLRVIEQKWMDKLKACDRVFGFNQAPAAGSLLGFKASDETRAKLAVRSAKLKGKPRSEEVKAKISATMKGRVFSPETIAKMSNAKKGTKHTEETKAKMKIKNFTVEGRERISASGKRRWAANNGGIGRKSKNSV
jgi:group I intron endonuclease